jgi:excisionase family DNA binding protein
MSLDEHSPSRPTKARPGRTDKDWPLLLNVREVAFELGLSTRRIYQLIAAGKLELVKIGKASRVPSASVLKLAGKTAAPGPLAEGMGGNTKAK